MKGVCGLDEDAHDGHQALVLAGKREDSATTLSSVGSLCGLPTQVWSTKWQQRAQAKTDRPKDEPNVANSLPHNQLRNKHTRSTKHIILLLQAM